MLAQRIEFAQLYNMFALKIAQRKTKATFIKQYLGAVLSPEISVAHCSRNRGDRIRRLPYGVWESAFQITEFLFRRIETKIREIINGGFLWKKTKNNQCPRRVKKLRRVFFKLAFVN